MHQMEILYLKYKKYLIYFLMIIIFALILLNYLTKTKITVDAIVDDILLIENEETDIIDEDVVVDIKGFVETPGVYKLAYGSRIIDVINKAGGLLEEGNTEHLNLSRKLSDQMVIKIYSNQEIFDLLNVEPEVIYSEPEIIYLEQECICEITDPVCPITSVTDGKKAEYKIQEKETAKISINSAPVELLITIPGIGEVKAQDIVEYRSNQEFLTIEDIMKVRGIGLALFDKIKDYIDI